MPELVIDEVEKQIDILIDQINIKQAEDISKQLAAAFIAGSDSITSTIYSKDGKKLSEQQERAIKRLSAEHFGYITEFNGQMGEQLKNRAREILREGGGYKEIADYTKQVLSGHEQIVINRVGQTRKIIQVGKDGTLREVEKKITRPYVTTVDNYADMLGRTATHSAWVEGRAIGHQNMGFKFWRFVGPVDERSRDSHVAVLGNVYEYGTEQSDLALQLLHEPHCRHRAVVFFDDPELDTPAEFFEEQKRKAGLYWDEENEKWAFRKETLDFGTTPKKEIPYTKRKDITKDEKGIIGVWQDESGPINAILRGIDDTLKDMTDEEIEKYSKVGNDLNNIVKKSRLKEDMILRRGLGEPLISRIKSGENVIQDPGFMAFSYHDGVPIMFAEKIIGKDKVPERHFYELVAKKGQTALFIGDANNHYESEVLFAMGTSIYVKESKSIMVIENGKEFKYIYHAVKLG